MQRAEAWAIAVGIQFERFMDAWLTTLAGMNPATREYQDDLAWSRWKDLEQIDGFFLMEAAHQLCEALTRSAPDLRPRLDATEIEQARTTLTDADARAVFRTDFGFADAAADEATDDRTLFVSIAGVDVVAMAKTVAETILPEIDRRLREHLEQQLRDV